MPRQGNTKTADVQSEAQGHGYEPGTPSDWTTPPHNVQDALDEARAAGGGGGGPHNLLSATHSDTVGATPPALGSIIKGDGSDWEEYPISGNGDKGHQLTVDENGTDIAYGLASKYIEVRKNTGGTITKGTPVYLVTWNVAGYITVEAADANVPGEMPAIGLAFEDITNAANSRVLIMGNFVNLDTSAFTAQDAVYVANGGGLTATKPTGDDAIQKVGIVGRSHASNGQLIVQGAGRTNDLPQLADENLWMGNASGVPTASPDLALGSGHAHFGTIINNTGAAPAIDLTAGNIQMLTLSANMTPTVTDPDGACTINLIIVQDSTARTIDWSNFPVTWTDAEGAPDLSTVSKTYIVTLLFDGASPGGSNYFGNFKGPYT